MSPWKEGICGDCGEEIHADTATGDAPDADYHYFCVNEKCKNHTGINLGDTDDPPPWCKNDVATRQKELEDKREEFLEALSQFLGGVNQVRMSLMLERGNDVATLWAKIRHSVPGLMGYPSPEEVKAHLRLFLGINSPRD
jgi:hypothetical protein